MKESSRRRIPQMVQLNHHRVGQVRFEANIRKPGAYHRARGMQKVISLSKSPSSARSVALPAREEGADRSRTFIVTRYVEPWMVPPPAPTSAPATDLALLKALAAYRDKRSGGQRAGGWPCTCGNAPSELVGLSLFDEATVVEENGHVSAMRSGCGREPPRRADEVALDAVEQRSLASVCDDQLLSASSPPSGRSRFPQRPIRREWSGRDDYTTLVGAPVNLLVVNDFAERGVALISAFCSAPSRAERGTATAPSAVPWSANRRCHPCAT
ncbi:hypothetical protein GWK47_017168 [Chionoecetes opilio]|uniref:Uncharacterized protein n=1 Tax=Chionoecetes opilio TaxID=41210 RepID=A0A8J5CJY6_CHIOP|nr:hypothetical protein GWK47_017168 [Chionoecetes opilio]